MKPINYQERNRMIGFFCASYLICGFVIIYWFTLLFNFVPKEQVRRQLARNEEFRAVLDYTNEADSLVVQIQKQEDLEAKRLGPFFKWTNDLKAAYPQLFYKAVVDSYTELVHEVIESKQGDSTLKAAKEKFVLLRQEEQELRKQYETLKTQLSDEKKAKSI
jgi:hypothetical protein